MKIAVIAANGRTGQAFVDAALKAGHSVRAGVRGANTFKPSSNLEIVECDGTNSSQVLNLIKGQDVVASFIGHVKKSPPDVQSKAIATIIESMDKLQIKRLISLTGTGVRFPSDRITLIDRFLNLSIGIIDPARIKDGKDHVDLIKNSDLDWTIIRVLKLQDVKPRPFKLTLNGPTKPYVGRREVALAVIEVIENSNFIKQAPIIGKV